MLAKISADAYDFNGVEVTNISATNVKGFAVLFDVTGTCVRVAVMYDRTTGVFAVNPSLAVDVAAIEWMHEHGSAEVKSDLEEIVAVHRDWLRDRDVMLPSPKMWDCRRLRGLLPGQLS